MMPPADRIRQQNEQDPGGVMHTRQSTKEEHQQISPQKTCPQLVSTEKLASSMHTGHV